MDAFIGSSTLLCLAYSDWMKELIAVTKGFKSLSSTNPEFMKRLGESNSFLQEFVIQAGKLHKGDKLYLNEGFFLFARIHRDKLKKYLGDSSEVQDAITEGYQELNLVVTKVIPTIQKVGISKAYITKYRQALTKVHRANKKVHVTKELQNNLNEYILPELKPLLSFIPDYAIK